MDVTLTCEPLGVPGWGLCYGKLESPGQQGAFSRLNLGCRARAEPAQPQAAPSWDGANVNCRGGQSEHQLPLLQNTQHYEVADILIYYIVLQCVYDMI